jgi:hypothetical protein
MDYYSCFWKGDAQKMMKKLRVSYLLEDCSQFTSNTKRSILCLPLQHVKWPSDQETAKEGSEILKREETGYPKG